MDMIGAVGGAGAAEAAGGTAGTQGQVEDMIAEGGIRVMSMVLMPLVNDLVFGEAFSGEE